MTDMAPFVAAVLKDRVMSDLISELNLLRAWKHDSEDVKITGPDCKPIYARGNLKKDGSNYNNEAFNEPMWKVRLSLLKMCPLRDSNVEVWVNDFRICSAPDFSGFCAVLNNRGSLTWQNGPRDNIQYMVHAALDGWTEEARRFTENNMDNEMYAHDLNQFVQNDLADNHPMLECKFDYIIIKKNSISH